MRQRVPRCVVSFHTTAGAMAAERLCRREGLKGKLISLAAGLAVGFIAQRSRLCMAEGLRDAFLIRDFTLLSGFLAIWVTVTAGNFMLGNYNLSMLSQPVAHSQHLWSFLGMALAGWGSILLGGIGTAGMIAVVIGFAVLLAVSLLHLPGKEEA